LKLVLLLLLTAISTSAFAHGMSPEDQTRILNAGAVEYMHLGAKHMLTGYDHLLFLFGVIFFLTRFKDILKFITVFTIGHSITLVLATLFGIQANYYLIDAVIALTVCYKAFDNLDGFRKYLDIASPNLLLLVFIFGLIHGFGLSTRLQQLPLGTEGLVLKILSFNVGVEIGQIIALSVMLVLLSGWRKTASFEKFSKAANLGLLLAGGLLFLSQMHGFQHSYYSDDFPINRDDHHHAHEDMEKSESALKHYPNRLNLNAPSVAPHQADDGSDQHSHDGVNYHSHE
jgi:hypothetical protein